MRGNRKQNNKNKTRKNRKKSVHVNITLPLSQIMRRIQVSHWYYCRYKAPAEEIKTIKGPGTKSGEDRKRGEKSKAPPKRNRNKKKKTVRQHSSGSHLFTLSVAVH